MDDELANEVRELRRLTGMTLGQAWRTVAKERNRKEDQEMDMRIKKRGCCLSRKIYMLRVDGLC